MRVRRIATILLWVTSAAFALAQAQNQMQLETIKKIRRNELTFGTWIYLKDPAITEMMSHSGFDWMIIDMEHGILNEDLVQSLIVPLIDTKCVPLVKIYKNDLDIINKVLDTGIQGIVVHMVSTKEDAEKAVKACKYPPLGRRDMGYARAQGWGQKEKQYLKIANDAMVVVIIIETKEGVQNIDEILEVPGIDVVAVGEFDLSAALGVLGQIDNPLVLNATRRVEEACKKKNINFASWANDKAEIEEAIKRGSNFVELAGDADLIWRGSESLLKAAREVSRK